MGAFLLPQQTSSYYYILHDILLFCSLYLHVHSICTCRLLLLLMCQFRVHQLFFLCKCVPCQQITTYVNLQNRLLCLKHCSLSGKQSNYYHYITIFACLRRGVPPSGPISWANLGRLCCSSRTGNRSIGQTKAFKMSIPAAAKIIQSFVSIWRRLSFTAQDRNLKCIQVRWWFAKWQLLTYYYYTWKNLTSPTTTTVRRQLLLIPIWPGTESPLKSPQSRISRRKPPSTTSYHFYFLCQCCKQISVMVQLYCGIYMTTTSRKDFPRTTTAAFASPEIKVHVVATSFQVVHPILLLKKICNYTS